MKNSILSVVISLLLISIVLTSCSNEDLPEESISGSDQSFADTNSNLSLGDDEPVNMAFYRKVARETREDGWVFTFVREGMKNGDDSELQKYFFFGINLRYRYAEIMGGESSAEALNQKFMSFGTGSEAESRDMKIIESQIINKEKTDEELLAIDPNNYQFEVLDKEMFFRLMHTAIEGEPQEEGTLRSYWNKPTYAFLDESVFSDGYKIQISFLNETGLVDELYIDVLYQTGSSKFEYVQLSDLVDSGKATEEQKEAFELIREITETIKQSDRYITDADKYKDKKIGGIDFARLYKFLEDIHYNKLDVYI